jgi:hypothetical protein
MAFPWPGPEHASADNDRLASSLHDREKFSEDIRGIVASEHQQLMKGHPVHGF